MYHPYNFGVFQCLLFFNFQVFLGICIITTQAVHDESQNARILDSKFENEGLGPYQYSFESSDGIQREETGELIPSIHDETNQAMLVRGSYSYTGPDGVQYTVRYVADESGFHPEGDHISVPPFVPWMKGQPIDDGQYRPDNSGKYVADNSGKYRPEFEENVSPNYADLKKTKPVVTGERILSEYLTTSRPDITQKYLPSSQPELLTDEEIVGNYEQQNGVTTEYLPAPPTTQEPPLISRDQLLQNAYYEQPQPRPEILLHSKPYSAQSSKLSPIKVPKPFALASQNVPISVPSPHEKALPTPRPFSYTDLNPGLRELINKI